MQSSAKNENGVRVCATFTGNNVNIRIARTNFTKPETAVLKSTYFMKYMYLFNYVRCHIATNQTTKNPIQMNCTCRFFQNNVQVRHVSNGQAYFVAYMSKYYSHQMVSRRMPTLALGEHLGKYRLVGVQAIHITNLHVYLHSNQNQF